jgi:hypothetical protein
MRRGVTQTDAQNLLPHVSTLHVHHQGVVIVVTAVQFIVLDRQIQTSWFYNLENDSLYRVFNLKVDRILI